jgi:hypothetical protein
MTDEHLIFNGIQTPDGTWLVSYSRHDYKTYTDSVTGEIYMVDGGLSYLRRNVNKVPATEKSQYHRPGDHGHNREWMHWGTRGPTGKEPVTYKPVQSLSTDHISAILETQNQIGAWLRSIFEAELRWRASIT